MLNPRELNLVVLNPQALKINQTRKQNHPPGRKLAELDLGNSSRPNQNVKVPLAL